jgi:zinc transporter ZupT
MMMRGARKLLEAEAESNPEDNVGMAFALTFGAGAFTLIGSSFVFMKKETVSKYIGLCLGLASGVIIYEGCIELYHEAVMKFDQHNDSIGMEDAYRLAAFTTLGVWVLGWLTTVFIGIASKWVRNEAKDKEDSLLEMAEEMAKVDQQQDDILKKPSNADVLRSPTLNTSDDVKIASTEITVGAIVDGPVLDATPRDSMASTFKGDEKERYTQVAKVPLKKKVEEEKTDIGLSKKELLETGILTAIIMFLHNLPEGLAVFLAALGGSGLGFGVAIAIGLHNIPQGFAVALPIYEATGDKMKAFWWSFGSGLSQPLASIFGYFLLKDKMTDAVYGVTFAYASGLMSYVALKVLLPAAHKTDPKDKYVSWSLLIGMFLIGLSLSFFDEA